MCVGNIVRNIVTDENGKITSETDEMALTLYTTINESQQCLCSPSSYSFSDILKHHVLDHIFLYEFKLCRDCTTFYGTFHQSFDNSEFSDRVRMYNKVALFGNYAIHLLMCYHHEVIVIHRPNYEGWTIVKQAVEQEIAREPQSNILSILPHTWPAGVRLDILDSFKIMIRHRIATMLTYANRTDDVDDIMKKIPPSEYAENMICVQLIDDYSPYDLTCRVESHYLSCSFTVGSREVGFGFPDVTKLRRYFDNGHVTSAERRFVTSYKVFDEDDDLAGLIIFMDKSQGIDDDWCVTDS